MTPPVECVRHHEGVEKCKRRCCCKRDDNQAENQRSKAAEIGKEDGNLHEQQKGLRDRNGTISADVVESFQKYAVINRSSHVEWGTVIGRAALLCISRLRLVNQADRRAESHVAVSYLG
jgi:hypothetical protein